MLNQNKLTKTKPESKAKRIFKNWSRVRISLCTTVVHNTAQNSSDSPPSYPLDSLHCSDVVCWNGGDAMCWKPTNGSAAQHVINANVPGVQFAATVYDDKYKQCGSTWW